jgi:hypothetical protein
VLSRDFEAVICSAAVSSVLLCQGNISLIAERVERGSVRANAPFASMLILSSDAADDALRDGALLLGRLMGRVRFFMALKPVPMPYLRDLSSDALD